MCSTPSEESLAVAKRHVEQNYILVGVQEDYEAFLEGLEQLIPQFFKGVMDYYRETGKVLVVIWYSTVHDIKLHYIFCECSGYIICAGIWKVKGRGEPVKLTTKTREKMMARLKEEYQLYEFARQLFYRKAEAWREVAKHN